MRGRALAGRLDEEGWKRLLAADAAWGAAAGLWIVSGLGRVFFGGKEPGFYWRNGFFWMKLALFGAIVVLELAPMITFTARACRCAKRSCRRSALPPICRRPPASIVTLAPIASRLLFVPSSRTVIQWPPLRVVPQQRRAIVHGHHQHVDVAVVVVVAERRAAVRLLHQQAAAARLGDMCETAPPDIAEQLIPLPVVLVPVRATSG